MLQGLFFFLFRLLRKGGYPYPPRAMHDARCSEISSSHDDFVGERSEIRQYTLPIFPRFRFFHSIRSLEDYLH